MENKESTKFMENSEDWLIFCTFFTEATKYMGTKEYWRNVCEIKSKEMYGKEWDHEMYGNSGGLT